MGEAPFEDSVFSLHLRYPYFAVSSLKNGCYSSRQPLHRWEILPTTTSAVSSNHRAKLGPGRNLSSSSKIRLCWLRTTLLCEALPHWAPETLDWRRRNSLRCRSGYTFLRVDGHEFLKLLLCLVKRLYNLSYSIINLTCTWCTLPITYEALTSGHGRHNPPLSCKGNVQLNQSALLEAYWQPQIQDRMRKPNQLPILKETITETETNVNRSINLITTFSFKQRTRFESWNVRSLLEPAKLAHLCRELSNYNLLFMGLSETRWPDSAELKTDNGCTLIYSGRPSNEPRSSGVAFLLSGIARRALIDWKPHSDRIITARFRTRARNMTCIQCYAPTETSDSAVKDEFYSNLSRVMSGIFSYLWETSMLNLARIIPTKSLPWGAMELGECLRTANYSRSFACRITSLLGERSFPIESKTWRNCLLDVRNKRGADCNSDHHLIVATIKLKVAAIKKQNLLQRRFDTRKLNNPERRVDDGLRATVNWPFVKSCFVNSAENIIGYKKSERKECISDGTWDLLMERRQCKAALNKSKTRIKRSARRDKRRWTDNIAKEAQAASESHRSRDLYKITKRLGRKVFSSTKPLRSSNGELITSKEEQLDIWVAHYSKMLNNPTIPITSTCHCPHHVERHDILTCNPSLSEIENAISSLKNDKAPEDFWNTNNLSDELKEGLIINIPKKGDLTACMNWRGITLLSMVNKVIANILNTRLADALSQDIRDEQASFRPNKSGIDHINSLRIITEQSVEWRSPLYLVFIDFEKAFDTLHHSAIWNALRCKGVPEKIISLIGGLYKNATCRILHEDTRSRAIAINVGVRQGCPLSPLLFNVVIDRIMARVTSIPRGITWRLNGRLEDLDYADDICLLSHKFDDMQSKLNDMESEAALCGLRINIPKTKAMRINATNTSNFTLQQQHIENVQSFCYLGSIITTNGSSKEDVQNRINKARQVYGQLSHVWNSHHISRRTKLDIFSSCVKSVALYGCESWNSARCDLKAMQVFINRCPRRILKIFWPNTISNTQLWELTAQTPVEHDIRRRKWRWIGHALRRRQSDITRYAIDWNPQGSRRKGRPSHTWRRQLDMEIIKANKSWSELKNAATDKREWNAILTGEQELFANISAKSLALSTGSLNQQEHLLEGKCTLAHEVLAFLRSLSKALLLMKLLVTSAIPSSSNSLVLKISKIGSHREKL
ncbi:LINE-1 reverse transcriptase like protein [Lucilia cuprina]|nr:LINE-1 reverse transcriptase like protein [Lucilia cuprina]